MRFTIHKASDWEFTEEVTIATIEDLEAISKQYEAQLVIDFERKEVIIYDDYLE